MSELIWSLLLAPHNNISVPLIKKGISKLQEISSENSMLNEITGEPSATLKLMKVCFLVSPSSGSYQWTPEFMEITNVVWRAPWINDVWRAPESIKISCVLIFEDISVGLNAHVVSMFMGGLRSRILIVINCFWLLKCLAT